MSDLSQLPIQSPFTVLVDSMEKHPFRFSDLHADSSKQYRPIVVPIEWQGLGQGCGDYSIKGFEPDRQRNPDRPQISIERKSIDDCIGTILGFGRRRERFEEELQNLSRMESSCVIVEGSMRAVMEAVEQHGKKTREENIKSLFRSWIAFKQDYPQVQWWFCDDRRLAEIVCFRWMDRFWRKIGKKVLKDI